MTDAAGSQLNAVVVSTLSWMLAAVGSSHPVLGEETAEARKAGRRGFIVRER